MKPLIAGVLLGLFTIVGSAADTEPPPPTSKPPAVGDQPPEIKLESLLQAPDGAKASWDALRGKVIVLEFWATWCGPCVEAIGHLNELTEAFRGKPVQFISITDEAESTIKDFLANKPIRGWVGLNPGRSMFNNFDVHGIPHTVIVGPDGKIAAVTRPQSLQAEHLENVLAGKSAGLPFKLDERLLVMTAGEPSVGGDGEPPVFQILIRPSKAEERRSFGGVDGRNRNQFGIVYGSTEEATTVADLLLSGLYGVTPARLVIESPLPQGKFDIFVKGPRDRRKQLDDLRRQAIEATFGLTSQHEMREIDAYVLTAKSGPGKGLRSASDTSSASFRGTIGKIVGKNVGIAALISRLESAFKQPVMDETGIKGQYDFEVTWKQPDKDTPNAPGLIAAVKEQLGLDLTMQNRKVDVVVVRQ
jgi:uncharacterized protein (TIGR03435 family)